MRIRDEIRNLKPYFIDEKSVKFKLDANESPFDLPDDVKAELKEDLARVAANRYPDPSQKTLRRLVAKKEGVAENMIIFGNGSDELIYMLYMAVSGTGRIAYPRPGFSMYAMGGKIFGREAVPYDLMAPQYSFDEGAFAAVLAAQPDIVFVANPNNPTGNSVPDEIIGAAAKANPEVLFLVDEAYGPFRGKSMAGEVRAYPNLVIMKTFSKIGFASIRLGYCLAQSAVVEELEKVRLPYNINSYSQKVAEYLFRRNDLVEETIAAVVAERERLFTELASFGMLVLPSEANFVTFRMEKTNFYAHLVEQGVLVKDLGPSFGMKGYFRLTVGRRDENDYVLKVVRDFVGL